MNKDEIAKLEWKGRCRECARAMVLSGNAAFAAVVNKAMPICSACGWERYDRETLDAIEADTNLLGLADYIEKLRLAAVRST